jgi:hypothetical protein
MKMRIKIQFLGSVAILAICCQMMSCEKEQRFKHNKPQTTEPAVTETAGTAFAQTYSAGTGSGDLTIDGKATTYANNSLIVIKPGTYQTINIQNLTNVTVENGEGAVIMDGTKDMNAGINFQNCSGVTVTRDPADSSAVPYGFTCQNVSYRPTTISGVNKNLSVEWVSYKNIGDYAIFVPTSTLVWDGTDATLQGLNLSFLHCSFDGCNGGPMDVLGAVSTANVTGLQKGFEVGYCTFSNCNSGDLCFVGAVDQYNIHDNTMTNINPSNNNDNGLFHMIGNGNFYRNYASNYQGHMIRMWTISYGMTPEMCLVYDNIGIGSRKYSTFEWGSTAGDNVVAAPNTTYTNIRLNNNIGGNLNTSRTTDWDACLVDNYGMVPGSTQEVYNNLLFNTFTANGIAGRFLQYSTAQDNATLIKQGNLYEANASTADFTQSSLSLTSGSPAKNKGVPGHLISPEDYHDQPFNTADPSVGAIE